MKKAVLFDLDGTLADTIESIAEAGNKTLAACGLKERPVRDYQHFAGDGADTLVRRFLQAAGDEKGSHYDEAYAKYQEIFETDCTYHVKPFDGMTELLEALRKKGIKMGVISNKPHFRAVDVVEKLFGQGFFDVVAGQKEGIPKKPDPASTLTAAGVLGVRPEDCLYVGDTNVDMQTGNAAGMCTVGVLWGFRDRKELEENHAQAIIAEPMELLGLI